ncbi:hypothetical protein FO519_002608 [Halicephalobus sp. NKZ332]|nr:hypothetical protein FO519_002608 [Halicephalobus sp. NKZ332]
MSLDKISMALDDVVKADRREFKKTAVGQKKPNGKNGNNATSTSTAKLVKKLVKKALAQRQKGGKSGVRGTSARTVVKKVFRKVGGPRGKIRRGGKMNVSRKPLSLNQKSRVIHRRTSAPATRTIVREIRYVREPVRRPARRFERVVYRQPRQEQRRVVYVDAPRRSFQNRGGSYYGSRNYLQRY